MALDKLKGLHAKLPEIGMVVIASIIVTAFITGARYGRIFEIFELVAYDRFMQRRPGQAIDDDPGVLARAPPQRFLSPWVSPYDL